MEKQSDSLKAYYNEKAAEHDREAAFCEGESWYHMAELQRQFAAEWRARIK